jgi:hypothetical protein
MRHPSWTSAKGTAVTETMLLSWILIIFFAAAIQIFVMNESLIRSVTAAHAEMLQSAFPHNHWEYDGSGSDFCVSNDDGYNNTYNTDLHAKVILNRYDFPEIQVQVLGIFRLFGAKQHVDIQSNYPGRLPDPDDGCPDYPCKKLKMAAGPAGPTDHGDPYWSQILDLPAQGRLVCKAAEAAGF